MDTTGYSLGDIAALVKGQGGAQEGMFGGGNMGIWLLILLFFIGGRNGLLNGANGVEGVSALGAAGKLDGIQQQLNAMSTNELTEAINAVGAQVGASQAAIQNTLCNFQAQFAQCCCQTQKDILALGLQTQMGFANTNANIDRQACDIKTAISSGNAALEARLDQLTLRNEMQTQTILNAINTTAKDTQDEVEDAKDEVLKALTDAKVEDLENQVDSLQLAASQNAQTLTILSALGVIPTNPLTSAKVSVPVVK